jgi:AraC family transcriptional regulator of adaptative response/methylated-DNA-[protein]-cysteine methyltransferase
MGLAFRDLREGKTVTQAALHSGYESLSGFGAAFSSIFGQPPSRTEAGACLIADWITTPLGPMLAIADESGLCLLEFHDRRGLEREIAWLRKRRRAVVVPGKSPVLSHIAREIREYFIGCRTSFETPLALEGSPFQMKVWEQLLKIRPGETRSYGEISKAIGAGGSRAVGRANGDNRLAIVVPCHRVIRGDGELCGYGGGIWRKRALLDHEAAMATPRRSSASS